MLKKCVCCTLNTKKLKIYKWNIIDGKYKRKRACEKNTTFVKKSERHNRQRKIHGGRRRSARAIVLYKKKMHSRRWLTRCRSWWYKKNVIVSRHIIIDKLSIIQYFISGLIVLKSDLSFIIRLLTIITIVN